MELATNPKELWYSSPVTAQPHIYLIFPHSFLGKLRYQGWSHLLFCVDFTPASKETKLALILDQHRAKILLVKPFFGFSIVIFLMLNATVPALKLKLENT